MRPCVSGGGGGGGGGLNAITTRVKDSSGRFNVDISIMCFSYQILNDCKQGFLYFDKNNILQQHILIYNLNSNILFTVIKMLGTKTVNFQLYNFYRYGYN